MQEQVTVTQAMINDGTRYTYDLFLNSTNIHTQSVNFAQPYTACGATQNPAGSLSLDRGNTAGSGNTVYLTCAGGAAYYTVRATNSGNTVLTLSSASGQSQDIAVGGNGSIVDSLGLANGATATKGYTLKDKNSGQTVQNGTLTVTAQRDPSCTPTVLAFSAGPSNSQMCANSTLNIGLTVQSPSGAGRITGTNGTTFSVSSTGTVSPRTDSFSVGNSGGYVVYTFQIDVGNGVYVTPAGGTSRVDWTIKTAGCSAPTGNITFAATGLVSGNTLYMCPGASRQVTVNATANVTATLSAGGQSLPFSSGYGELAITVSAPNQGNYNPYPADLRALNAATPLDYETLNVWGRNSECAGASATLSVTGGQQGNCSVSFAYLTVAVQNGTNGVVYDITKNGVFWRSITGSNSAGDTIQSGQTFSYAMSSGGQSIGSPSSISYFPAPGCGGIGDGGVVGTPNGSIVAQYSNLVIRSGQLPPCTPISAYNTSNNDSIILEANFGGVTRNVYRNQLANDYLCYSNPGTYTYTLTGPFGFSRSTTVTVVRQ